MKTVEIIKMWNSQKGSRFPSTDGSSIWCKIDSLRESFGEELITDYFYEMVNQDKSDIWFYADEFKIENFKRSKKPEINALDILGKQLMSLMGNELAVKVSKQLREEMDKYIESKTITKVYEFNGVKRKVEGIAHKKLETVLKFVAMNEPVIMVGPAGTGKNVIAKQIAEALNLEFYFSNAVTQEYKITGYGDANGGFVSTQFYEAFTKGGIFLLDEIDASCPEALIVMNCAIANGYFDFPVIGRVEAHEDFRVIACANTYGTGASLEYVGRNQLDGATLNRFAIVEIDYDNRIEDGVCPNKEIADFCRDFRKVCEKNGVHHIVSYRELSRLYKMIEIAKLEELEALKSCLLKGLENDSIRMIANNLKSSKFKDLLLNNLK